MSYFDFKKPDLQNMERIARSFAQCGTIKNHEIPNDKEQNFAAEDILFGLRTLMRLFMIFNRHKDIEKIIQKFSIEFKPNDPREEDLLESQKVDMQTILFFIFALTKNILNLIREQREENKKLILCEIASQLFKIAEDICLPQITT